MPQKTSAEQCTLSEISPLSLFKIKLHAGSLTHFDLFMFLLFKLLYIDISWSSLNPLKCQMHLKVKVSARKKEQSFEKLRHLPILSCAYINPQIQGTTMCFTLWYLMFQTPSPSQSLSLEYKSGLKSQRRTRFYPFGYVPFQKMFVLHHTVCHIFHGAFRKLLA